MLAVLLMFAIVVATGVGSVQISPVTTAEILLNQLPLVHLPVRWPVAYSVIIIQLRLPTVAGATLVGAALGVSGVLFQGLLRNPLADPLLLGTSSGAALGATIAFMVPAFYAAAWLGLSLVAILAFMGALVAVALVYQLARARGQTPVVTLLLAGVAVSAMLTAAQTLLITFTSSGGFHLAALYLWISGGVSVQSWGQVGVTAILTVAGLGVAWWLGPVLDALALGEEMAGSLGLRVELWKAAIVATASVLVAAAVSISGLVGFVGLVSPHICRLVLGPRHRLLVLASALFGATFVVLGDMLARTLVAPTILPLGVITALVGGPFFLWLLRTAGLSYMW